MRFCLSWGLLLFYAAGTFASSGPCNLKEECQFGMGQALLLANQISLPSRTAFRQNWQTVLDHQGLILDERIRTHDSGCHRVQDLYFAPSDSPIGRMLAKKREGFAQKKNEFTFEQELGFLRDLAEGKPALVVGADISTSEKAKELLAQQKKWEQSQSAEDLAKAQDAYVQRFKQQCDHSKESEIKNLREQVLKQNGELDQLQTKLDAVGDECTNQFRWKLSTDKRYQKNELAQSRFGQMKNVAIKVCTPLNAIHYVIGDSAHDCAHYVSDIYDIVAPECESRGGNEVKGNNCNGLHRSLKKIFLENPAYEGYLRKFIEGMTVAKESGQKIDLLELANQSTQGDRAAAMRLIALVGHDEINTTMKSIREELLRTRQYDRLAKNDDLYSKELHVSESEDKRFSKDQVTTGNMTLFKDLIRSGSTVGGQKLTGRYYHFVAGAFLACELRERGYGSLRSANAAANAGFIYEAFDFKSHIQQGVGLKESINNFKNDTSKHENGGKLGSQYCG